MQKRRKYRTKKRIKERKQKITIFVISVLFLGTIILVGYNLKTGVFSLSSLMKLGASSLNTVKVDQSSCLSGGKLKNGVCTYTYTINSKSSCYQSCYGQYAQSLANIYISYSYNANSKTCYCNTKPSTRNCTNNKIYSTKSKSCVSVPTASSGVAKVNITSNKVSVSVSTSANGIKDIELRENNSTGTKLFTKTGLKNKNTKSYSISSSNLSLPSKGKTKKYYIKVTDLSGLTTYQTFSITSSSSGKYSSNVGPTVTYSSLTISGSYISKVYFKISDSSGIGTVTYKNSSGKWVTATQTAGAKTSSGIYTSKTVSVPSSAFTVNGDYAYVYIKVLDSKGMSTIKRFRLKYNNL